MIRTPKGIMYLIQISSAGTVYCYDDQTGNCYCFCDYECSDLSESTEKNCKQ
jgi:hypothetical protein